MDIFLFRKINSEIYDIVFYISIFDPICIWNLESRLKSEREKKKEEKK
jgi:hypothetical protein